MMEGFEMGADDYIVKPFKAQELRARVLAKMRMADTGFQARQVSTRSNEPVQSEAFKNGNRNS